MPGLVPGIRFSKAPAMWAQLIGAIIRSSIGLRSDHVAACM